MRTLPVVLLLQACVLTRHEANQCKTPAHPSYVGTIQPIMAKYCTRCHAGEKPAAGFAANAYRPTHGGGTAVEKWSLAYRRIQSGSMPVDGEKPGPCEIAALKTWIEQGAVEVTGLPADSCGSRLAEATPLRRLSAEQYENTLRELLPSELIDRLQQEGLLAALPIEQPTDKGFSSFERDVTLTHVQTYFDVASWLSDQVNDSPSYRAALEPCLGDTRVSNDCRDAFVQHWARRAWRRSLSAAELSDLTTVYDDNLADGYGVGAVVFATLQSPSFLYHLELNGSEFASEPRVLSLSDDELASRLSYLAWNTMPDAELRAAADRGALHDEVAWGAEVARVFGDVRARPVAKRFFREWLNYGKRRGSNFSADFLDGIDVSTLFAARQDEIEQYLLTLAFDDGASYSDLLTSNAQFVSSPTLATVYGVTAQPQRATFSDARRAGLLTKAALLAGGDDQTHPVQRGVFIMRRLLCKDIALPDASQIPPSELKAPDFDPSRSARERWAARTEVGACASCHSQINPYGFLLENYDSLGRYRTTERIYDPTTHALLNQLPIDATAAVAIEGLDPVTLNGAGELAAALSDSKQGELCLAQQWFRYSYGRREDASESCAIAPLSGQRSIKDLWMQLALQPEFHQHRIGE